MADAFASRSHTQVAVGGPAGNLADFTSATSERLPLVVVALSVAVALLLMIALRSIVMPIVAVVTNLIVVAATFGALTLLFGGSDPLLGGPGYIDAMSINGIFAAVFGLSIAFQVFLLTRIREQLQAGDEPRDAVRRALRATAAPVTGAAATMVAAVVPFFAADLLTVRQFGLAVAIAVLLDALIVRPVVLPAAVELVMRRRPAPTAGALRPAPPVSS
jgi:RND superfamily putative drug exporter